MTREEARKAAEVMIAYADGKEIEFNNSSVENNHHWEEAKYPIFNWCHSKYRVKSEPKYRPFETKEDICDFLIYVNFVSHSYNYYLTYIFYINLLLPYNQ